MKPNVSITVSGPVGLLLSLSVACGSQSVESGVPSFDSTSAEPTGDASTASDSANVTDSGTAADAATASDPAFACGNTMCGAKQFCVHPCCGGAESMCTPPAPFCVDDPKEPRATGCMLEQGTRDLACVCG